jgi:hypothetical protein
VTNFRVLVDAHTLRGVGLADVQYGQLVVNNKIYQPLPGESLLDNMPTLPTLIGVSEFTTSRDIYEISVAAAKLTGGPFYLELDSGDYFLNNVRDYNSDASFNWIGYPNGNRQVLGYVSQQGWDAQGEFNTRIVTSPTMLSSSPGAAEYARDPSSLTAPLAITAFYFDNSGVAKAPLFFSGINFQGQDQTPLAAFSTNAQTRLTRNKTALSPAPWNGLNLVNSLPGSKFQYCRLDGFSYSLDNSPPYELGALQTNRGAGLEIKGVEIDGRIHSRWDANRPRRSGGLMLNKETITTETRTYIHHTRRSGSATNTNTKNEGEQYLFTQANRTSIADPGDDGLPSDISTLPGNFNAFNIEGVVGLFDVRYSAVDSGNGLGNTFSWALPYSGGSPVSPYVLPNHVVIRSWYNTTTDTKYGGCLTLNTPKAPNSTGTSPIWTAIAADMNGACTKYFDFKSPSGVQMQPIPASQFNSLVHDKEHYYVLRAF